MADVSTPESMPELIDDAGLVVDAGGGDLALTFTLHDPAFFLLFTSGARLPAFATPPRPRPARRARRTMAIDPVIPFPEAHDLAQAQKGFYSCSINVSHWQLRHYISTPEQDHLYYASGTEVFCLNTATKERKHIATLPFEARCTASGYGWVCVGGGGEHEGHFAAIKLDVRGPRDVDSVRVERMGEEIVNSISIHRIQDIEAHLDDIVAVLTNNDKTVRIYSLPAGQETRVKDLPFAINHATISPDGQMMVAVGDYNQAYFFQREIVDTPPQIPKPHNRLTSANVDWRLSNVVTLHVTNSESPVGYFTTAWSPSGMLVAVGSEGGYVTVIDTELLARPDYEDDEAVVAIVPGSRADLPSPHPGAIRSMVFSPEPWDLLIWAEDYGRVCIGDLRTGLKSKQVINLEPMNEQAWESLPFEDVPLLPHLDDLEADTLRRWRNNPSDNASMDPLTTDYSRAQPPPRPRQELTNIRVLEGTFSSARHTPDPGEQPGLTRGEQQPSDNASTVNWATDYNYIRAQPPPRRRRQELTNMRVLEDTFGSARHTPDAGEQPGLTRGEQQVLDALRISRQREESRANGDVPRSVNYTSADMFARAGARSSTLSNSGDPARPFGDVQNSVPDSFPELSRTHAASQRPSSSQTQDAPNDLPPLQDLRDGIWGSSSRPHAATALPPFGFSMPRQRPSVTLSSLGSATPGSRASATNGNGAARGASEDADDENPWRTIEEHLLPGRGPLFEGAARAQAASPLPAIQRTSAEEFQQEREAQRRVVQAQARAREQWRSSRFASEVGPSENTASWEARRGARLPEGYEALLRRAQRYGVGSRNNPERTAGLAISPDGRTLWAACEKGIFEIQIRVKGRMFLPAMDPR